MKAILPVMEEPVEGELVCHASDIICRATKRGDLGLEIAWNEIGMGDEYVKNVLDNFLPSMCVGEYLGRLIKVKREELFELKKLCLYFIWIANKAMGALANGGE